MGFAMTFEFETSRILFGKGVVKEVPSIASAMGRRVLMVTGRNAGRSAPLLTSLTKMGLEPHSFRVTGEPTIKTIVDGAELAHRNNLDCVIGIGGGSVMDSAKAVAALLTNSGDIMDYLEVIGKGKPLTQPSAPCIAIPTTAGTGAEVTKNAVLTSPEYNLKVSLRSPSMMPDLAVVDPDLTYSLPPTLTASTGLDALTQLLESFISLKSNPITDALCVEGLKRAARSLRRAYENGSDPSAREDMAIASLLGGLALANAKLGAVHGIAGPMGGMFPVPHGIICARLLPFVMEINVRALQRNNSQQYLSRYDYISQILTGRSTAKAKHGIAWVHSLCDSLDMPALTDFGIREDIFSELVARSKKASSMKGNPVQLTDEELTEVLKKAIQ
jgi:alcohol dehydrogenase class IV